MSIEASDQELIAGCLRGDKRCWDAFVERFARLVHWSIRESLDQAPPGGHEEFCREVFQDFFERLIDRNELSKLRRVENVRKFLSVMACHLTFDRLKMLSRHARKMQPAEDMLLPETGAPSAETPWSHVVGECLEDLPPKDRACLDLYFVQARTAAAIGEILGVPEDTVRSVVRRAKEKLRKKLLEKGYQE